MARLVTFSPEAGSWGHVYLNAIFSNGLAEILALGRVLSVQLRQEFSVDVYKTFLFSTSKNSSHSPPASWAYHNLTPHTQPFGPHPTNLYIQIQKPLTDLS